jgi:large subunit ribosomal protein L4
MAESEKKVKPEKKATTSKAKSEAAMSIQMYDLAGKPTTSVSVSEMMFGQKENKALISQYIRVYTINQRQGTVSAKTRSEVNGTTKKVWRQKGTGRARHGSDKAALFVGGGVTFGPRPRTFSKDMNKKQKKLALFIALSMKMKNKDILGLDAAALTMKPKTKEVSQFVKKTEIDGKKTLFILPEMKKEGLVLSTRNMKNIDMVPATTINPYEVLNHSKVVFVGDAVKALETHFLGNNEN